jgi:hypothetical protein
MQKVQARKRCGLEDVGPGARTRNPRIKRSFQPPRSDALLPVHLLACLSSARTLAGRFPPSCRPSADRTRSSRVTVGRRVRGNRSRTRAWSSTLSGWAQCWSCPDPDPYRCLPKDRPRPDHAGTAQRSPERVGTCSGSLSTPAGRFACRRVGLPVCRLACLARVCRRAGEDG